MVHFTCDLCGQELHAGAAMRYVVKLEVYAACDPLELTDEDLDGDYLEELGQMLEKMDHTDAQELEDGEYKSFRFDLCPDCQRKFVKDPLGREALQRIDFSEN